MSMSKCKVKSSPEATEMYDRIRGALYGFAIGDAMGATTEFLTAKQITKRYGFVDEIVGGGVLNWKPGQVTDDTDMMLCVCKALMETGEVEYWPETVEDKTLATHIATSQFAQRCVQNFIDWYHSGPIDIGGQCATAIETLEHNRGTVMRYDRMAMGNGSLMRALPCALIGNRTMNVIQSVITHNNKVCIRAVETYHNAIQSILSGNEPFERGTECEHSGYVKSTLYNALWYANQAETFYEAIVNPVNAGGDADTIAALTGGLAGARFGYSKIPQRWVAKLDTNVKQQLDEFAKFALIIRHTR